MPWPDSVGGGMAGLPSPLDPPLTVDRTSVEPAADILPLDEYVILYAANRTLPMNSELVTSNEAGAVKYIVGFERDSEETSVRLNRVV